MKLILKLLILTVVLTSCSKEVIFDKEAGNLRMAIDNTGKITVLEDVSTKTNYISGTPSYLVECMKYYTDTIPVKPILAKALGNGRIELSYPNEITLIVVITPKDDYFHMELTKATPLSEVDCIVWGPYNTNMQGYIGEWLGIIRSDDFTMGIMSLEPNTDGKTHMDRIAYYTNEGASMELVSFDHTKGKFRVVGYKPDDSALRGSKPIDVTVLGSRIALYSSKADKDSELDVIEKIELAEGLPHPVINGEWNKRSIEGQKFCIWAYYNDTNFDEYLDLSKEMGARTLCKPGGFSNNWGHFDIDTKAYPEGMETLLKHSKKAKEAGVGTTLYTLTTFLKPLNEREPYVAPIPDNRLQTWKYGSKLKSGVKDKNDTIIVIDKNDDVLKVLEEAANKVIRIDNEIIEFKYFDKEDNFIRLKGCQRGAFFTDPANHKEGAPVTFMYISGYHNFFPGTIELSNELSDNLFKIHKQSQQDNFVVDGFESCLETGYGCYTGNLFMKNFYDKCVLNNIETLVTGSNFSQYSWHITSHESWGEGDQDKGVRGTMLDYRLSRQMLLANSHMPKKLGQYYPSEATVEDIEWIMAFATGWDSGVDFQLNINTFKKNPAYKEIVEKLSLWAEARNEKIFTEEQKMNLRQTDRQYKLSKTTDGKWELKFDKYWKNEKAKILPPWVMNAKNVDGGTVKSCTIDWLWTHNPATYNEIYISDDMIHQTADKQSNWKVTYPEYTDPEGSWYPTKDRHFQFVLRLPENAPCAISDIRIKINDNEMIIPVTINPGEYISMPQLVPMFCIYNSKHEIIGEKIIRGFIPILKQGKTANLSFSYTPKDANANPEAIMNIRCQNGYFYQ